MRESFISQAAFDAHCETAYFLDFKGRCPQLLGAGALGVDATPIEGFDAAVLNQTLGLHEKGLTATLIVSLGYRAEDDFNRKLPKSRLPLEAVLTEI